MHSTALKIIIVYLLLLVSTAAHAAPKSELWSRWQANNPQNNMRVDHADWAHFLDKYLIIGQAGTANLIRYAEVSVEDKKSLEQYLNNLSNVPTSKLNRTEQKAFWINLYNALTVQAILANYPVESIRDISSGWFSSGPWDLKLISIEGVDVSLNDIEHRILRPIWNDNRVHYAVNCASLGCPNLQSVPFSAENIDQLLDRAARDFINSPRGVDIKGNRLYLSSIYDWFQVDFGSSEEDAIKHIQRYAKNSLAENLKVITGTISYQYDWNLNQEE